MLRSPIVSPNYDLQLPTTPEASLSDEATILLSPRYNTVEQESAQALLILSDTDGHGSPLHCVDCYIRSLDKVELAAQGRIMKNAFNAIDWPEWPTFTIADHRLPTSTTADHRLPTSTTADHHLPTSTIADHWTPPLVPPPPYSPTRQWLYEPIVVVSSDHDSDSRV